MMKERKEVFATAKETAEAFGDYLMKEAGEKSVFHCALSGGSTPKMLFDYLAVKYKDSPLWRGIHFYWGDERCVSPEDAESNFKMTKERLLDHIPIPQENIHRVLGEKEPEKEAERYGQELLEHLPTHKGLPVFDLIILGMGEDGHTASIFPHQMELMSSEEVCRVAVHPDSGQRRVTLTGPVINAAHEVVFLVTGAGKKDKVSEIFNKTGGWESYPAAHISPEQGNLVWFLDEAAVGK
ncbi:MAG: 6-phosphogluconolactonase [Marinoscillum sp.]|uniref:6-phosphogluconolactonase n=1 Tax=Marinoscillum sp. TaxID=2024838 RepID=UPI0032F1FCC9